MIVRHNFDRNAVLTHAKVAALCSTVAAEDAGYEVLEDAFTPEDITGEAEEKLIKLIDDFFESAADLLEEYPMGEQGLGHSLILTVNHHFAGFWEHNMGGLGVKLTGVCRALPEYELYVGDDGKLHA